MYMHMHMHVHVHVSCVMVTHVHYTMYHPHMYKWTMEPIVMYYYKQLAVGDGQVPHYTYYNLPVQDLRDTVPSAYYATNSPFIHVHVHVHV